MSFSFLPYCEECGEARVPHFESRLMQGIGAFIKRLQPVNKLLASYSNVVDKILLYLFTPERILSIARFFARFHIGAVTTKEVDTDNTRTQALFEGSRATGVTLYAWRLFGVVLSFVGEKEVGGITHRVAFDVIPRPRGFVSPSLPWLDNKAILKQKLKEAGIPCADGGVAYSFKDAQRLFREIGRPVIAKPESGSRGRHTTLDIRDENELLRAFQITRQLSRGVIIEAYLKGTVHRVTLVGQEPVAIARREYPHIVGDGIHTVRELVSIENEKPYRNSVHFRKINLEHRSPLMLKKQELTLDDVPEKGRKVVLNDKNSRLHGTLTEDVTEAAHPENIELFRHLGDVLGDPIVGVDFMIEDMSRSWKEQPDAGVIECNSMPFIDVHHRVVSGKTINVAAYLWDVIFGATREEVRNHPPYYLNP